jgi:phosphate transport system permease protein
LILTALGNTSFNANPTKGKQDALPLFVYRLIRLSQPASIERAWTGAFVLLGIVLVLFIVARLIGGRGPGHISRFRRIRLARKGLA